MSRVPGSVCIIGVGAVARMLAYFFQSQGVAAICYGRSGPQALRQRLQIDGQWHELRTDATGPAPQLCLLTTKAYDLPSALGQWLPAFPCGRPVVILCNGYIEPILGSFRTQYPEVLLRKGVVSRGARWETDGSLTVSARGEVIWGDGGDPTLWEKDVLESLAAEGFAWDPDACARRKEKWFCNTVLNTLSGIYQLRRNEDVFLRHATELDQLCHEVYALGCEFWPEWQGLEAFLKQKLSTLVAATQDNENSMARDVRLGRRTEVDVLSGHVRRSPNFRQRYPLLSLLDSQLSAIKTSEG